MSREHRHSSTTTVWNGAGRYHSISCACPGCLWLDKFAHSAQAAPVFEVPPTDPVPVAGRGHIFGPAE